MAMVCTSMTEWIHSNISKPVEEWEQDQVKKCKKRRWYDPRGWFCWFITVLVKVIRWVVVTVVTAVVTIVCHLVADVLAIVWDVLKFLWHLLKALFTWDKCALQEAFADFADAFIRAVELIGDVIMRPITDRIQTYRLRRYVGRQIAQRYWQQPDLVTALKEAFSVDAGVFGYRTTCTVYRMFVDSRTKTERFGDVPNLFALHRDGLIDLYQLAGFDQGCAIFSKDGWYRPRHQSAKFPFASGGGGIGEPTPPELSRDELTEYIDSAGTKGPHFLIYAISAGNLDTRCDAARQKGRQLGLILNFERKGIEVVHERYIDYTVAGQPDFLMQMPDPGRHDDRGPDAGLARMELCAPVAVAVFGFDDRVQRGVADNLIGTVACDKFNLADSYTSGVSFIDDIPDEIRKYVLIHELGHYFGLCHVDGFDRIMVSGKKGQGDWFTGDSIPNVFWHGGPRFTYTEAQRAWDFILANFPSACLAPREGFLRIRRESGESAGR